MSRARRAIAPALLAVVAAGAALAGLRVGVSPADEPAVRSLASLAADSHAGPAPVAPGSPATPVLSARRIPRLLVQPLAHARLVSALEGVIARAPEASCLIVERAGNTLLRHQPDVPLIPASAMKLAVATAVLERLGPQERLVTRALAGGSFAGGVVDGSLYLVGGGDPLVATTDYAAGFRRQPQIFSPLEVLADLIVARGVTEIRGGVIGDEHRYDDQRYVDSWRPVYVEDHETGPMSALAVNDGFVSRRPRPVPADQPARHGADLLAGLLRARGVAIHGDPDVGTAPRGAAEVAAMPSYPMSEIVAQMLRESDNQTAELLVKELGFRFGGSGSTAAGSRVIVDTLVSMGLPVEGATFVDGSGLDRDNRLTCDLLHRLLVRDAGGGAVGDGLAIAGESGTLEARYQGSELVGRLRAKTGSINGVAALVGEVTPAEGTVFRFAFVVNGIRTPAEGRQLQDELSTVLARFPDVPTTEALEPHPVGGP